MLTFAAGQSDAILSVAYDFYGRRMALCSADHTIRVFDKSVDGAQPGGWSLVDSWRAHDAAIVQVSWAGPGYPELLASASHDSTVKMWEEDHTVPFGSGKRWKLRYTISDFKGPVYDLQFSPSHQNLKVASIAADGVLHIHEAVDPNNLGYWPAVADIPLLNHPVARQLQSAFSISWCPSLLLEDHLVVSVLEDAFVYHRDPSGKYVRVAELLMHKGLIRCVVWAPSMGRSYQLIATASKDGFVRVFKLTPLHQENFIREADTQVDKIHGSFAHSESAGSQNVASGERNAAAEFQVNAKRTNWSTTYDVQEAGSSVDGPPTPSHSTATGAAPSGSAGAGNQVFKVEIVHEDSSFNGEVWRVAWNLTGTILACTGDDGTVRLWKSTHVGNFQQMAVISADQRET